MSRLPLPNRAMIHADNMQSEGWYTTANVLAECAEALDAVGNMTTAQYLAALHKLGLTPSSQKTADTLGLSLRQCQRIASGDSAVPGPVEKLLRLMVRLKLKPEDVQ